MPFTKCWKKRTAERASDVTAITDSQQHHNDSNNTNDASSIKKRVTCLGLEANNDGINHESSISSDLAGWSDTSTGATALAAGQTSNIVTTELSESDRRAYLFKGSPKAKNIHSCAIWCFYENYLPLAGNVIRCASTLSNTKKSWRYMSSAG